jgi:hypothetical protein
VLAESTLDEPTAAAHADSTDADESPGLSAEFGSVGHDESGDEER